MNSKTRVEESRDAAGGASRRDCALDARDNRLALLSFVALSLISCETEYSYTAVTTEAVDIHDVVECAFEETTEGWEQYTCVPVFSNKDPGVQEWEADGVGSFDIVQREIFGAPFYQLWYSGVGGATASSGQEIGYAVSMDGVGWTRHPWNPVLTRGTTPGSFDRDDAQVGCVAFDGDAGVFHLWYTGTNGTGIGTTFGHATSRDGVIWDKDLLNPLDPFEDTDSALSRVWGCDALYEAGAFHFWVGGLTRAGSNLNTAAYDIGYLRTVDGANFSGAGDVVLSHSGPNSGAFDAEGVHRPSVFTFGDEDSDEDRYWMLYAGYETVTASQPSPSGLIFISTDGEQLGMASSPTPDAGWTKLFDGEPVPLDFSGEQTADAPRAFFINGRLHVFFNDTFYDPIDGTEVSGIGLGISPFPVVAEEAG